MMNEFEANKPFIINGLLLGDEGKGSWVDYLTATFNKDLVVRFNGGANAAHHVVSDNKYHCFSQFGSGTFSGADTLFSKHTLIEPLALKIEADKLTNDIGYNPLRHLFIAAEAKLITPFHVLANRLNQSDYNTTGMGIGVTVQDSLDRPQEYLKIGDLFEVNSLIDKLYKTRSYISDKYGYHESYYKVNIVDLVLEYLDIFKPHSSYSINRVKILNQDSVNNLIRQRNIIFEGAQGILLDEKYGEDGFNTWSNCTKDNAVEILAEAGIKEYVSFGVTRTYATRHGKGKFSSILKLNNKLIEPHNSFNESQGDFKRGWLDVEQLKYAIKCNKGIDFLLVSHYDALDKGLKIKAQNDLVVVNGLNFIPRIEKELGVNVFAISSGAERKAKLLL